jgi:hypothetical protein
MRLYKIKASGNGEVLIKTKWVGSAAEGVATRKELYAEGFARKEVVETQVDVPTDKAGLLEWLNNGGAA